ncbi:MAG TPA: tetratricopeptide repeat protein [Candidatus Methylacidiphilales bacterium]|nr:tetratricopeptide repeat protein [Candidatus Methylacidiphilales bacterium]
MKKSVTNNDLSASTAGKVTPIPSRPIWMKRSLLGKPHWVEDRSPGIRWAVLSAVCVLVIGIYIWSSDSGILELECSSAKETYYNLLVDGFRAGQLNVKRDVPSELARITDPNDPALGNKNLWVNRYYLHDLSYYKGKLYLYFGPTPALALFWPFLILTGRYLLHKDAGVIFFSAGFLIGVALLCAIWRRYFKEISIWIIMAGALAFGLANFAPVILGRCDVYEVAISCGYMLIMLVLAGLWRAFHDSQRQWRWIAAASLAYGLAVGARPSLLLGAPVLLLPVMQAWPEKRKLWPLLLAAGGPIGFIGIALMLYNVLRFDNPLEFGQSYQLPVRMHQQFSPHYFWFNFRVGFLDPAGWNSHFPFVHDIVPPAQPLGYYMVYHPFGALTNIPVVWLALAAPLAWQKRTEKEHSALRWFLTAIVLLFGTSSVILCLHDSMCLRYEVEYASLLVLLAVIGILAVERALASRRGWLWMARCGWGLLLAFSIVFNLLARLDLQQEVYNDLGALLAFKGKVDEAVVQYEKALAINPYYVAAYVNLGNALNQEREVDGAIVQYRKALELDPRFVEAHNDLGAALLQKGQVDEALAHFQQAMAIDPGDPKIHNNLGWAFLQKGKVDEAISQYQKALIIEPDYAEAHNNLGWALLFKGQAGQAVKECQKALQIDPTYSGAYNNLGIALIKEGRPEAAIFQFQAALRLNPNDAEAQNNLTKLEMAIRQKAGQK